MKENVGTVDRVGRFVVGPALMALGYGKWGGNEGTPAGLAAIVSGALVLESAVTRVCPVNAVLGIDSRSSEEVKRDFERTMSSYEQKPIDTEHRGLRVGS